MFPELPPFAAAIEKVRCALLEVGQIGGILDAGDDLDAGAKALIVDPAVNGNPSDAKSYGTNPDNPTMTAGSTFVGQFIDHDLTFDQTSTLGDPRNDEHVIIAGLHAAHILFYNRVLTQLREWNFQAFPAARLGPLDNRYVAFLLAREVTLWHYQWLLVNEHLPQVAGSATVADVLAHGNRFYDPPSGDAFMPIEFGAAAYRFGHSMVRPSYRANFTSGTGDSTDPAADPFFALVFNPSEPTEGPVADDRSDLLGGYPARRRYVGWQTFFDFGDGQVKNNKKIDATISSVLFTLPVPAIAPHTQTAPLALPQRNLLRQLTWGLPSGQAVAQAMGVPCLQRADLAEIGDIYPPFATSTPLWYYILAEAKAAADGLHLGPVGGRLVAETLIGLLRADPSSYLNACPQFQPFLGADLALGAALDPYITGNRSYTRPLPLLRRGCQTRDLPVVARQCEIEDIASRLRLPVLTCAEPSPFWPRSSRGRPDGVYSIRRRDGGPAGGRTPAAAER